MVQLPSQRHRKSAESPGPRTSGRVRWFDQIRGVGLVDVPGKGYAHVYYKDILGEGYRALDAGDEISFWIEESERGPILRDVRRESSLPRE